MEGLEYIRKLTISSTMEGLKECLKLACEIQKEFNFDSSTEFAFQTILMESVSNAIHHGNKLNKDLLVKITIAINQERIKIEVEDQGEGFDLEKVPSPVEGNNILLENGRGIFFMRQLSNSFETKGRGNIVDIIIQR